MKNCISKLWEHTGTGMTNHSRIIQEQVTGMGRCSFRKLLGAGMSSENLGFCPEMKGCKTWQIWQNLLCIDRYICAIFLR